MNDSMTEGSMSYHGVPYSCIQSRTEYCLGNTLYNDNRTAITIYIMCVIVILVRLFIQIFSIDKCSSTNRKLYKAADYPFTIHLNPQVPDTVPAGLVTVVTVSHSSGSEVPSAGMI